MNIADLLIPGRRGRRRDLELSIDGVTEVARARAGELDGRHAALWNMLCDASRETLRQLLIRNDDELLDWNLKKHIKRVNDFNLVIFFWWMLLYQIVLFKTRGLTGYDPEDDAGRMHDMSLRFVTAELEKMGRSSGPPSSWADDWERQFPLESAMSMYNSVYNLLGLSGDLTIRIQHVSHFTTITEKAYDRLSLD